MIEYLPQAISSLSAAKNIISALLELRDFNKLSSTVAEINNHIIKAQNLIFTEQEQRSLLTAKIQALEKECMRLKDWSAEKEQYSRKQIAVGIFAYVENNHVGNTESAHKLCCNCFYKNIKSTLQQSREPERMIGLVCPNGCPKLVFTHYTS